MLGSVGSAVKQSDRRNNKRPNDSYWLGSTKAGEAARLRAAVGRRNTKERESQLPLVKLEGDKK